MNVVLKSRKGTHYATGEYENDIVTVDAGSRINTVLSYDGMSETLKALRKNPDLVSSEGVVLQKIAFKTPSEAAQFVTGRSSNGYITWRIDDKTSLKAYRETKEN